MFTFYNKYYRISWAECLLGCDAYVKAEKAQIARYWSNTSIIYYSRE